jgi:hypothetical protein
MRTVIITLLLGAAAAGLRAQETIPDTTAPWRYQPLGPSDIWEYAYWIDPLVEPSYLDPTTNADGWMAIRQSRTLSTRQSE